MTWYELELMPLTADLAGWYPIALYNRTDENAGFDLHASAAVHVEREPAMIPFGIAARLLKVDPMPHGGSEEVIKTESHFFLLPRSSIYKSGLLMANSVGVIDKSYRGELKAPVWSITGDSNVAQGERLFQICAPDMGWIRHVRMVEHLPETARGAGGFGSTGAF